MAFEIQSLWERDKFYSATGDVASNAMTKPGAIDPQMQRALKRCKKFVEHDWLGFWVMLKCWLENGLTEKDLAGDDFNKVIKIIREKAWKEIAAIYYTIDEVEAKFGRLTCSSQRFCEMYESISTEVFEKHIKSLSPEEVDEFKLIGLADKRKKQ